MCVLLIGGIAFVSPRVQQLSHDDQVHYVGHLLAGRVLSLCPCTAQLAQRQYNRGLYHARTPLQMTLLTTEQPTNMHARLAETSLLASAGLRWLTVRF